jgi:hypothetical protein
VEIFVNFSPNRKDPIINELGIFQTIKPDNQTRKLNPFMDLISGSQIYGGIHRFCLRISGYKAGNALSRFKFGVSKTLSRKEKMKCFSDFETGYSFISMGQTRNGSNESGLPYVPGQNNLGKVFE